MTTFQPTFSTWPLGEREVMTIQVDAMFKNGTTPTTNRDFQRLFTGVLRRSFEIEDIKVLRMSMARNDKRQLCGLFDLGTTIKYNDDKAKYDWKMNNDWRMTFLQTISLKLKLLWSPLIHLYSMIHLYLPLWRLYVLTPHWHMIYPCYILMPQHLKLEC